MECLRPKRSEEGPKKIAIRRALLDPHLHHKALMDLYLTPNMELFSKAVVDLAPNMALEIKSLA